MRSKTVTDKAKASMPEHPAYGITMERLVWAVQPIVDEIEDLEKQNHALRTEIAILKNLDKPEDELQEYTTPVTFEIAKRVLMLALKKGITKDAASLVLKKRKLSMIPEDEYPHIVDTFNNLINAKIKPVSKKKKKKK